MSMYNSKNYGLESMDVDDRYDINVIVCIISIY